jgi:hypothetical protein
MLSLGIWLMAAGMWPVGFLFGACSACCDDDPCAPLRNAESVEVDILAEDYFLSQIWQRNFQFSCGETSYASGTQFSNGAFFPGSDIDGTWQLDFVSSDQNSSLWETTFGDTVDVRKNILRVELYNQNSQLRQMVVELKLVTRRRFVCESTSIDESDLDCPSVGHPYSGFPATQDGCQFPSVSQSYIFNCDEHDRNDEPAVAVSSFPILRQAATFRNTPIGTDFFPFQSITLISETETGSRDVEVSEVRAYL